MLDHDWHKDNHNVFESDPLEAALDDRDFAITQVFGFGDDRYDPATTEGQFYRWVDEKPFNPLEDVVTLENNSKVYEWKISDFALMIGFGIFGAVCLSILI